MQLSGTLPDEWAALGAFPALLELYVGFNAIEGQGEHLL